ncbi:MAG: Rrf2 family transcriptional regulator [Pseudomonadota bacterium]
MKRNSRLYLALHTLSHMAVEPDRMRTSADIAEHAGTNPVVVRRVLGQLRKADLLKSEKGHAGGWRLARPAEKISLADVYIALDERMVGTDEVDDDPSCSVERALQKKVTGVLEEIEATLIHRLGKTTILEICGK